MPSYEIPDMTCGGCVRAIRAAVARVAPSASLEVDLATRRVSVEGEADAAAAAAAVAA
ncbi:MAG: cation transporter, partial [Burkholderiales bacterium]